MIPMLWISNTLELELIITTSSVITLMCPVPSTRVGVQMPHGANQVLEKPERVTPANIPTQQLS